MSLIFLPLAPKFFFFFPKVHHFFFFQWIETPWERFMLCEAPLTLSMALFVNRVLRFWGKCCYPDRMADRLDLLYHREWVWNSCGLYSAYHQLSFWQGRGYESVFYRQFRMNESKISHWIPTVTVNPWVSKKKKKSFHYPPVHVYTVWMTIKLKTGLWNPPLGINLC